jgi:hypothetical protein
VVFKCYLSNNHFRKYFNRKNICMTKASDKLSKNPTEMIIIIIFTIARLHQITFSFIHDSYFHSILFSQPSNDMMDLLKLHLTLKWRLFMLIYEFMFSFMSAFNLSPDSYIFYFSFLPFHSTTVFIIAITFSRIVLRNERKKRRFLAYDDFNLFQFALDFFSMLCGIASHRTVTNLIHTISIFFLFRFMLEKVSRLVIKSICSREKKKNNKLIQKHLIKIPNTFRMAFNYQ